MRVEGEDSLHPPLASFFLSRLAPRPLPLPIPELTITSFANYDTQSARGRKTYPSADGN